jgi:hypothetical protein
MTIGFRADATGNGILQVNGTDRLQIGTGGQIGIGGATYGTAGQVLTSNGPSAPPSWNPGATVDTQTFNSSGTWTKPSTGNFVRIQMWGGGGGGNRSNAAGDAGAGGGGGYFETTVPIASMGATAAVTVGAGGAGRTASLGPGASGGNSGVTLGNGLTIYVSGGQASGSASGGGNGGWGGLLFNTTAVNDLHNAIIGAGAGCSNAAPGFSYTGGGGGRNSTAGGAGGWGGGGGGSGAAAGGTSAFGGAGGNASIAATQPGGGGGASASANVNGNNGAAGRVIITTY